MLIRRLAFAALAVIFAYFAVASASWNSGYAQDDLGIPSILPDDPGVTMRRAVAAFHSNGGRLPGPLKEDVTGAFQYNLLQEEPLLFEAVEQIEFGNSAKAIVLLEEARQRDPRSSEVRIILLDRYLSSGNVAASIEEIGVLGTLLPSGREALAATAIGLLAEPKTRDEASKAMRASPMRMAILGDLANYGASPYLIMAITPDFQGVPIWADGLIAAFINRGDIQGAYLLWAHAQAIDPKIERTAVRNGNFDGKPAPPFGWELYNGPAGSAKISGGSVQITHSGASGAIFLRQLLMLPPGPYRLSFDAEKTVENAENLVWRVDCVGSGKTLLQVPLTSLYSFEDQSVDIFEVPSQNCPAQWVALAGRPLEIPKTKSIRIERVSIDQGPAR
jgi:hypothetical protein